MITTILAALAVTQSSGMSCAVNLADEASEKIYVEYAGMRVGFCCPDCQKAFGKDPGKYIEAAAKAGKTVAESYFDPVAQKHINFKKAVSHEDYKGVRYYFATAEDQKTFDTDPKKYTMMPKKDSLTCAVMGDPIDGYSKADSYVDYEGVRYYMCCSGCTAPMTKEPGKYAAKAKVSTPVVIMPKS